MLSNENAKQYCVMPSNHNVKQAMDNRIKENRFYKAQIEILRISGENSGGSESLDNKQ